VQLAQGALDVGLVAGGGLVGFALGGGVADEGLAEFAPVVWLGWVSLGDGFGV
jgi:hypothetical protein